MIIPILFFKYALSTSYKISADKKLLEISSDASETFVTSSGVSSKASSEYLERVVVYKGITELKENSFAGFSKMVSIELPVGLKYIQDFCFDGCSALKSITFPEGFLEVFGQAFRDCKSLSTITISSTVKSFSIYSFGNCVSIAQYKISSPNKIFTVDSTGRVLIANKINAVFGTGAYSKVTIPDQIEIINSYFLSTFKNVTEVVFGKAGKLRRIESQAFRHTSIKRMVYPEGLQYVGNIVLEGVDIEYISIPSTLTSHDGIFSSIPKSFDIHKDCKCLRLGSDGIVYNGDNTEIALVPSSATTLRIGSSIRKINFESINKCKTLKTLTVESGNGNFYIHENSLYNSDKYMVATAGGITVVKYWSEAYYALAGAMQNLNLDQLIFEPRNGRGYGLGYYSVGNTKIKNGVTFPEGMEYIGTYVFADADIPSMIFPASLAELGDACMSNLKVTKLDFSKCSKLKKIINVFPECKVKTIIFPPQLESFELQPMKNCVNLNSIELPSTLKTICDYCFYGCSALTSVVFKGELVTTIGRSAFSNCKFASIKIPKKIQVLPSDVFANNPNLKTVTIPSDSALTEIATGVFRGCNAIDTIDIPAKVKTLTSDSFIGMDGLQKIIVNSNNPTFASSDNCLYVKSFQELIVLPAGRNSIRLHKSVRTFRSGVFQNHKNLASVTYDPGAVLSEIKENTFLNCQKLTSISVPPSVATIAPNSFKGCSNLANIQFGDKSALKKIITDAFSSSKNIVTVTFGASASLEEIEGSAFINCVKLTNFNAHASLKKIGAKAFSGCSTLNQFTVFNAAEILDDAFSGCAAFTEVKIGPNVQKFGEGVFQNCNRLVSVIITPK